MNSKLTAEGIMGAAMRMGAKLSGGEFPISVFPHKIQRIITELHASQGYPIDYIAAAMLSALAVSIGNSHLAQVKRGWMESPILYMALIGRPGANKSHPLSFAFHPFIEHDYRHNKEYQEQYAEYERTMSMTKKERLEAGKDENAFDAGIYQKRNSTSTQQRVEPRQEVVRQEPSEESSLSAGLLDLATAPATDPEEEMLAKQYVKKKKKPQRKRGFRL